MSETLPQVHQAQRLQVTANDDGVLRPRSLDEGYRLATLYHKANLLPKRFDSPESIMTGMQYALELGLKPLTALRNIAIVNGTPSLFGDLPLAMCYASGKLEWIKEVLLDAKGIEIALKNQNALAEPVAAACTVKRKGEPEPREIVFSLDMAKRAGLMKNPVWQGYPKVMLKFRARSEALRDKFPDALNGISIAEYDHHILPHESDLAITAEQPTPQQIPQPEKMIEALATAPQAPGSFVNPVTIQAARLELDRAVDHLLKVGGNPGQFMRDVKIAEASCEQLRTIAADMNAWEPQGGGN